MNAKQVGALARLSSTESVYGHLAVVLRDRLVRPAAAGWGELIRTYEDATSFLTIALVACADRSVTIATIEFGSRGQAPAHPTGVFMAYWNSRRSTLSEVKLVRLEKRDVDPVSFALALQPYLDLAEVHLGLAA